MIPLPTSCPIRHTNLLVLYSRSHEMRPDSEYAAQTMEKNYVLCSVPFNSSIPCFHRSQSPYIQMQVNLVQVCALKM